jgi:predicted nucleic acid-binding protein
VTWIVDSSIALAWTFEDEVTPRTDALLDRVETDPPSVPAHWSLELTNSLRTAVRRGRISEEGADRKAAMLLSLPVMCDTLTPQLAFTATFGRRESTT